MAATPATTARAARSRWRRSAMPVAGWEPGQARPMDKDRHRRTSGAGIARRALRAREAGFDIVYVYAAHDLCLMQHFISRRYNHAHRRVRRADREPRAPAARGHRGHQGGGRRHHGRGRALRRRGAGGSRRHHRRRRRPRRRRTARRAARPVGRQHQRVAQRQPDRALRRGRLSGGIHLLGQAGDVQARGRASAATPPSTAWSRWSTRASSTSSARPVPRLPIPSCPRRSRKAASRTSASASAATSASPAIACIMPMRCTQNPTKGEEWRRGWHPERIAPKASDARVLVVGAGPAGLEAARALGQRGYAGDARRRRRRNWAVTSTGSATLPGLASWARVRDCRIGQIQKLPMSRCFSTAGSAPTRCASSASTTSRSRPARHGARDGVGRSHRKPIPGCRRGRHVLTPDDVIAGRGAGRAGRDLSTTTIISWRACWPKS